MNNANPPGAENSDKGYRIDDTADIVHWVRRVLRGKLDSNGYPVEITACGTDTQGMEKLDGNVPRDYYKCPSCFRERQSTRCVNR